MLDEIGSGGMGVVYRARHLRLRRLVALKVLHPEKVPDEHRKNRFLREARAASALAHPGIVTVFDLVTRGTQDILVMELVDGTPLDEILRQGALPWTEAVEISVELGDALHAAHSAGIVHRDLKPSNVMVIREDPPPTQATGEPRVRVKLLDFGIAKLERAFDEPTQEGPPTTLTLENGTPGTPAYMSPEQALGESVDARSDIFSFGTLLYEMLTGRRPFRGPTPAALAHQLIFSSPAAPTSLVEELPRKLDEILRRAMAKKPRDRYPDMASLLAELRTLGDRSEPLLATVTKGSRHRFLALAPLLAGAAGLALLAGAPWIKARVWPAIDPIPETVAAAPEFPRTPFQHYESGMRRLLRFDREGYLDAAIEDFEAAVAIAPDYAPAWSGLALANLRKYRSKRETTWLRQAAQHANHALELDPLLTEAGISLARIKTLEGKPEEARRDLERLRDLDPRNADTLVGLAEAAFETKDFAGAVRILEQAIELRPEDWRLHAELGRSHLATGDLEAAEAAFRATLDLVPDNAFARHNLGAVLHYQGRFPEAVAELQQSITIRPTARGYTNLGTAYFFQGLYREAATALEAARELGASYYIFWSNLGDAYRQIPGKEQDAVQCFERAVQLLQREIERSPRDAKLRSRLATYLVKAGDPQSALREIALVEPLAEQPDHVAYRATLVYELAGDRQQALRSLTTALEAGYPLVEILNEPDLVHLRQEVAFHQLALRFDLPTED